MTKYKLIKEYPGSPKLGTMINSLQYQYNNIIINVLDYPEYWQAIVEKDYEILSFVYLGTIYKKDSQLKDKYCIKDGTSPFHSLEDLLRNGIKIHSIKRLSDGEIFTINDQIIGKTTYSQKIQCFDINDNSINFRTKDFYIQLKNAIKIKQPLFTTEDGVDVFEGDNDIFYIYLKNLDNVKKASPTTCSTSQKESYLFYKNKEKAEEYILMNKPCLSLKDIKTILNSKCKIQTKLTELVKTKLNL